STADLTGRTLEFLGRHAGLTMDNRQITRGVEWLMKNQQADGSWYGRWGICYLYGTWAALTGMTAVGLPAGNLSVRKAVDWLNAIQNQDGGWGESCKSDIGKKYMPLGASTPSQTAWALDALIAAAAEPTPAMERAVSYLVSQADHHDWRSTYPTGAGLPGGFYIHYHSYRYIWPLIALGNYRQKYGVDG
ncbi:hypothetical protein MXD81_11555, partial [Microbacteriaceae bacterium K1510]|nr:hypothetical protein [Microbacteriaceae bacterium K1510]